MDAELWKLNCKIIHFLKALPSLESKKFLDIRLFVLDKNGPSFYKLVIHAHFGLLAAVFGASSILILISLCFSFSLFFLFFHCQASPLAPLGFPHSPPSNRSVSLAFNHSLSLSCSQFIIIMFKDLVLLISCSSWTLTCAQIFDKFMMVTKPDSFDILLNFESVQYYTIELPHLDAGCRDE